MTEELTPSEMDAKHQAVQDALVKLREGLREKPELMHSIMEDTFYDATKDPEPVVLPPPSEWRDA